MDLRNVHDLVQPCAGEFAGAAGHYVVRSASDPQPRQAVGPGKRQNQAEAACSVAMAPEFLSHIVSDMTGVPENGVSVAYAEAKVSHRDALRHRTHLKLIPRHVPFHGVGRYVAHQDQLEIAIHQLAWIKKREIVCHVSDVELLIILPNVISKHCTFCRITLKDS